MRLLDATTVYLPGRDGAPDAWLAGGPTLAIRISAAATGSSSAAPDASLNALADPVALHILRNALGVIPAQLLLLFWLTRMSPEHLQFKPAAKTIADEPLIDPKDVALHGRLMQAIDEDQVYLRPRLVIEDLADLLTTPTHQLRHLINAGMGYRNFASFLNRYRLAHAKAALADSDRARETVLAIAYESGFASLQSFNRVFKEAVGQTPTDFRTAALASPAQN